MLLPGAHLWGAELPLGKAAAPLSPAELTAPCWGVAGSEEGLGWQQEQGSDGLQAPRPQCALC